MSFSNLLNEYIENIGCSSKALSEASGLPASTICRYRAGERVPAKNSPQFESLVRGLFLLAENLDTIEDIKKNFEYEYTSVTNDKNPEFNLYGFKTNLSDLMDRLHMSIREIAEVTNKDISYISRIRAGERKPAEPRKMVEQISDYIIEKYSKKFEFEIIAELLDCRISDISGEKNRDYYYNRLFKWLYSDESSPQKYVKQFIHKLDEFSLEDYVPEKKLRSGNGTKETEIVYGVESLARLSEGFVESTIRSDSEEPVTICWSSLEESTDIKEYEHLVGNIAYILEKGLHIRSIHLGETPIYEMMKWLEIWLPLYMTGQIESYYIGRDADKIMDRFIMMSGSAVLESEGLHGNKSSYRTYLTRNFDEISHYNKMADVIIDNSNRMISVIDYENKDRRKDFVGRDSSTSGKRKNILSTPPIYTISDDLLSRILIRNEIPEEDRIRIKEYIDSERMRVLGILEKSQIEEYVSVVSKDEYDEKPVFLSLSGLFYEKDIFYTYEEYQEHLELVKEFQNKYKNYLVRLGKDMGFRKIQIFMHEGQWVMVSKNKSPAIHFVIEHPAIRQNMEKMLETFAMNN